jgi:hypothetical protein
MILNKSSVLSIVFFHWLVWRWREAARAAERSCCVAARWRKDNRSSRSRPVSDDEIVAKKPCVSKLSLASASRVLVIERRPPPPASTMSGTAAEVVIEEVWTPKAAAEVSALRQRQQPKSAKFAALAGGIPLAGAKSDDNLQPYRFPVIPARFCPH